MTANNIYLIREACCSFCIWDNFLIEQYCASQEWTTLPFKIMRLVTTWASRDQSSLISVMVSVTSNYRWICRVCACEIKHDGQDAIDIDDFVLLNEITVDRVVENLETRWVCGEDRDAMTDKQLTQHAFLSSSIGSIRFVEASARGCGLRVSRC